jgi:hypothetical protein
MGFLEYLFFHFIEIDFFFTYFFSHVLKEIVSKKNHIIKLYKIHIYVHKVDWLTKYVFFMTIIVAIIVIIVIKILIISIIVIKMLVIVIIVIVVIMLLLIVMVVVIVM